MLLQHFLCKSPFRYAASRPPLLSNGRSPHAPHLKGNAFHDSENQRRESISVFLRVSNDLAHGRGVVVLHASSECERHKVLCQSCCEHFRSGKQRVLKSIDSSELPDAG